MLHGCRQSVVQSCYVLHNTDVSLAQNFTNFETITSFIEKGVYGSSESRQVFMALMKWATRVLQSKKQNLVEKKF